MKKAAVPSILIAVVLLAVAVIAEAQQPVKVPRIGILRLGEDISKFGLSS
jgi:predicted small integral membrane protein